MFYNSSHESPGFDEPILNNDDIEHGKERSKITEIDQNSEKSEYRIQTVKDDKPMIPSGYRDEEISTSYETSNVKRVDQPVPIYDVELDRSVDKGLFGDEKLGENQGRDDELFELTPDQHQAFRELKLRNKEDDYDDFGGPFAASSSTNDDFGLSLDNLSPRTRDPPELSNQNNNDQYLGNNFFSEDKQEENGSRDQLFDLSPDQQQAFRELELRKQQPDYDDDYDYSLNYDQVPEYDVREKLQSLNAQLANEPLPPDAEHRNSKVVFRDEIVSLVAPADSYDASESEPEEPSYATDNSAQSPIDAAKDVSYSSPLLSPDSSNTQQATTEIMQSEKQNTNVDETTESKQSTSQTVANNDSELNDGDNGKEDMVVSRGGTFQLLGTKDIIDGTNRASENDDDKSSNYNEGQHRKTRPISAPALRVNRHRKDSTSNVDSESSTNSNKKSTTQIPRVDKEALRRQQERKKREEEEATKRKVEEQNVRKDNNAKLFNSWLEIKEKERKKNEERKKKEEEEEKKEKERIQDERKVTAVKNEKELNKKLENVKRMENKLRQYRLKEMEDSTIVHSEAECRKAFKEWLKRKQKDHQSKVREDRQRARITRLAMRQCRKSQDLAQAIHQSNSFRYLDFCGYP